MIFVWKWAALQVSFIVPPRSDGSSGLEAHLQVDLDAGLSLWPYRVATEVVFCRPTQMSEQTKVYFSFSVFINFGE